MDFDLARGGCDDIDDESGIRLLPGAIRLEAIYPGEERKKQGKHANHPSTPTAAARTAKICVAAEDDGERSA